MNMSLVTLLAAAVSDFYSHSEFDIGSIMSCSLSTAVVHSTRTGKVASGSTVIAMVGAAMRGPDVHCSYPVNMRCEELLSAHQDGMWWV